MSNKTLIFVIIFIIIILSICVVYDNDNDESFEWKDEFEKINETIDEIINEPEPVFLDRVDGWTCFDYTVEYNRQYPEWDMVVISDNQWFQGTNHLVNYKINEDRTLLIHDEYLLIEYEIGGWEYDDGPFDYYHFYINNETPSRNYRYLTPNAEKVYSDFMEKYS